MCDRAHLRALPAVSGEGSHPSWAFPRVWMRDQGAGEAARPHIRLYRGMSTRIDAKPQRPYSAPGPATPLSPYPADRSASSFEYLDREQVNRIGARLASRYRLESRWPLGNRAGEAHISFSRATAQRFADATSRRRGAGAALHRRSLTPRSPPSNSLESPLTPTAPYKGEGLQLRCLETLTRRPSLTLRSPPCHENLVDYAGFAMAWVCCGVGAVWG